MIERYVRVHSRAQHGIQVRPVTIEVHTPSRGRLKSTIIGWPEELTERTLKLLRTAIETSGFRFPQAPVVLEVQGEHLPGDRFLQLPMAIALLALTEQLQGAEDFANCEFYGALNEQGEVNAPYDLPPFPHVLASRDSERCAVIPHEYQQYCSRIAGARLVPATHLAHAYLRLRRGDARAIEPCAGQAYQPEVTQMDLAHLEAPPHLYTGLLIAAVGGHSLCIDQRGAGVTSIDIARCLHSLLPPLTAEESLLLANLGAHRGLSISLDGLGQRRFESLPFDSIANDLLGFPPRIGRLLSAHLGVLWLSADSLARWGCETVERLTASLATGEIRWSWGADTVAVPAQVQLVIKTPAQRDCPCGNRNRSKLQPCHCSPEEIATYVQRLSPQDLLDRCPLRLVLETGMEYNPEYCGSMNNGMHAQAIVRARRRQMERSGRLNAQLTPEQLAAFRVISPAAEQRLTEAAFNHAASPARMHAVSTVALSLADFAGSAEVDESHVSSALPLCGLGEAA
jgi:magnesium chelatase family protein